MRPSSRDTINAAIRRELDRLMDHAPIGGGESRRALFEVERAASLEQAPARRSPGSGASGSTEVGPNCQPDHERNLRSVPDGNIGRKATRASASRMTSGSGLERGGERRFAVHLRKTAANATRPEPPDRLKAVRRRKIGQTSAAATSCSNEARRIGPNVPDLGRALLRLARLPRTKAIRHRAGHDHAWPRIMAEGLDYRGPRPQRLASGLSGSGSRTAFRHRRRRPAPKHPSGPSLATP